jgi:hypothetical protein
MCTEGGIAVAIVEEIVKRPVSLMIAVGNVILSVAAQDEDEALNELKEATKGLAEYLAEKIEDKAKEAILKSKAVERFKEALLQWLQSYSKRSRKYFIQIIDDIVHLTKDIVGLTWTVGGILLTPSAISPDACGSVQQIEKDRISAIMKVFKSLDEPLGGKLTMPRRP